ncbi:hypothetical protein BS78_05G255900 [Paspalum vaginatum]|nr:hypothetical protein BS78_05G255900 [Paspalum vaginatum]
MAAGFWDIVGKAANLLQLLGGLHYAATLITTAASSFLRFYEANEGCRKLEERVRMLRVLLPSPGGCWIMTQPHLDELGHLVTNALNDAHDLVDSYNGSTLFARIRRGRTMATRSRDLPISIDSYCGLILSVNAVLIVVLANPPPPPSLVRYSSNSELR